MAELPKYIMLRKVSETKTGVEYQVVEELPTQSNAPNTVKALTNADSIRSMTDEELAKWFVNLEVKILNIQPMLERPALEKDWLEWLQKEC